MSPEQIVEATLFASQAPLTPAELARADESLDTKTVRAALERLRQHYESDERAFQVYQLGDGFQILTRPEFAPYLERFDSVPRPPTLSRAALETLAIVAYRQPIGRIEIEEIRGVASTSVLRTLQDWELIEVVGRGEGLGRPLLYGTTAAFLDHFGFQSLGELPRPDDLPVALVRPDLDEEPGAEDEAEPGPRGNGAGAPERSNGASPAVPDTAETSAASEDAER
ncbi:MAG: SMC-Scp complex subunit ScpB [Gemmatimonadota bacterium]|nr:SMC-Scp complex subunit ScpB [Gemmatimonadota bacterium]